MRTRISALRLVLLRQYTGPVLYFEGAIPPRQQLGNSICIIEPIETCLLLYSIPIPLDTSLHFTSLHSTRLIFLLSTTVLGIQPYTKPIYSSLVSYDESIGPLHRQPHAEVRAGKTDMSSLTSHISGVRSIPLFLDISACSNSKLEVQSIKPPTWGWLSSSSRNRVAFWSFPT